MVSTLFADFNDSHFYRKLLEFFFFLLWPHVYSLVWRFHSDPLLVWYGYHPLFNIVLRFQFFHFVDVVVAIRLAFSNGEWFDALSTLCQTYNMITVTDFTTETVWLMFE